MNTYIYTTGNTYIQKQEDDLDLKTQIPTVVTIAAFNNKPTALITVTYPVIDKDLQPEKVSYAIPEQWQQMQDDIAEKFGYLSHNETKG